MSKVCHDANLGLIHSSQVEHNESRYVFILNRLGGVPKGHKLTQQNKMLENEARNCSFVVVGNIPGILRSSDLRAFFSHLVEKGGFVCFHYRHRPEHVAPPSALESTGQSGSSGSTTREGLEERERDTELVASEPSSEGVRAAGTRCCVAAVDKRLEEEFLSRYRGRHWAKPGGELLRRKIKISRLSVSYQETNTPSSDRQIGND